MDEPKENFDRPPEIAPNNLDPKFQQEVRKLYNITVGGRWLFVGLLWLSVGSFSLGGMRSEIALWQQHFTWVAVKYAIIYNRLPALGLSLCIAMTASTLIWQSRNILWGMPQEEQRRLQEQVNRIRQQGVSHPLWKWVCQPTIKNLK